jgi:Ca2+-binding RTX toxin-like protein
MPALNGQHDWVSYNHSPQLRNEDMPTIKYYEALGVKPLTREFDVESLRLHTMTADEMSYIDKNGATVTLHGWGFKYTARGEVDPDDGGTVSSIAIRDADGNLLQTIKHIDPGLPAIGQPNGVITPAVPGDFAADATNIYNDFKTYGAAALSFIFNSDTDHVIGSRKADFLEGGDSSDSISGNAGNDILSGGTGPDHLTGGTGKDMFFFERDSGHDIVTDFHNGQDHVQVAQGMYDRLEMHQDGKDLILDFGWGDQMVLENVQKSEINDHDFLVF